MAAALASQSRIGIGAGFMRLVAARFSVKVYRRVARITIVRWRTGAVFTLEALLAGPRFYQRSIHAEVFVGKQIRCSGLTQNFLKQRLGDISFQQPVAVLAVDRCYPHLLVHLQTHEPAEQQVILQLFHQHPLTAHAVQNLQQKRPQELFRGDRGTPCR